MSTQDRLTFLEDKTILIISSVGLFLVTAAVFWVTRQQQSSYGRANRPPPEHDDAEGLHGGRTRVLAGGREALKAARKQAKKRAKAEFRESSAGQKRRNRLQQNEKKSPAPEISSQGQEQIQEAARCAQALQRLESYILSHKVSSLETLENELRMPSEEIATRIEELEIRGVFTGIMIDDANARSGNKRSFVRVSKDELHTLAAFINQRGRLTTDEVASEANLVLQLSDRRVEIDATSREKCRGLDDTRTCATVGIDAPSNALGDKTAERSQESSTSNRVSESAPGFFESSKVAVEHGHNCMESIIESAKEQT